MLRQNNHFKRFLGHNVSVLSVSKICECSIGSGVHSRLISKRESKRKRVSERERKKESDFDANVIYHAFTALDLFMLNYVRGKSFKNYVHHTVITVFTIE